MATQGIRKINMPATLATEIREYAWRNRQSISQVVRDVLLAAEEDIGTFMDYPDDIHGNTRSLTVYVPSEIWDKVRREAFLSGQSMSALIRQGLRATIEAEAA